jgi:hypothetical protein
MTREFLVAIPRLERAAGESASVVMAEASFQVVGS